MPDLVEDADASEQLRQFIYAASHDLQEPLRGIIAYAQLLQRQFGTDPAAAEFTAFILNDATRMRDLLQQLVVYSRAGSAKQHITINLNVPLQMALLKLAPEIHASGAKITRVPLPEAIGDEAEISQVFHCLLSNSLRFRSEAAPEITISAEQGTDTCTVTLRDNGLGLDPHFSDQALLPFKRLHGKEVSGHGLGLAICDKIIRAHQGRLWLESDGASGTAAHVTLPT
jgi:light-regulated signal transduction histidine kinase (bacteriophytochrome)